MALSVEQLFLPVSGDSPCGERIQSSQNLSALLIDLEAAKQGDADRQSFSGKGTSVVEQSGPDWKSVKDIALRLCQHSRDLQVVSYLCMALLHTEGVSGFSNGLRLIHELLVRFWGCIHPELDPDEPPEEAALERSNILLELGHANLVAMLRKHALVTSKLVGGFSLNDIQAAYSDSPPPSAPKRTQVEGVFAEVGLDATKVLCAAVTAASAHLQGIQDVFKQNAGPTSFPDFSKLTATLREIHSILDKKVRELSPIGEQQQSSVEEEVGVVVSDTQPVVFSTGQITNRADVTKAIEKVCEYYKTYEPGSPVPLLLERAKRLVNKEFIEIMEDLSPDSVKPVKALLGIKSS